MKCSFCASSEALHTLPFLHTQGDGPSFAMDRGLHFLCRPCYQKAEDILRYERLLYAEWNSHDYTIRDIPEEQPLTPEVLPEDQYSPRERISLDEEVYARKSSPAWASYRCRTNCNYWWSQREKSRYRTRSNSPKKHHPREGR